MNSREVPSRAFPAPIVLRSEFRIAFLRFLDDKSDERNKGPLTYSSANENFRFCQRVYVVVLAVIRNGRSLPSARLFVSADSRDFLDNLDQVERAGVAKAPVRRSLSD